MRAVSQVDNPRMLDERAEAAAVVAAEELPIDGACVTATSSPRQEQSVCVAVLGPIVANRSDPAFWIYPSPLPSSLVLPIELTQVHGGGNCNGTYGATAGLTNQRSPEYRKNGVQTTGDTAARIVAVRRA